MNCSTDLSIFISKTGLPFSSNCLKLGFIILLWQNETLLTLFIEVFGNLNNKDEYSIKEIRLVSEIAA